MHCPVWPRLAGSPPNGPSRSNCSGGVSRLKARRRASRVDVSPAGCMAVSKRTERLVADGPDDVRIRRAKHGLLYVDLHVNVNSPATQGCLPIKTGLALS